MNTFQCENRECEDFEKKVQMGKISYVLGKEGNLVPKKPLTCSKCRSLLKEAPEEKPLDLDSIKLGKFRSMNLNERKEMLRKRAALHDNSPQVKEKKEFTRSQAIKNFFNE